MHYYKHKNLFDEEHEILTRVVNAFKHWENSREHSQNELYGRGYDYRTFMRYLEALEEFKMYMNSHKKELFFNAK